MAGFFITYFWENIFGNEKTLAAILQGLIWLKESVYYLINSIFWVSSILILSKNPCSLIHSSLNTLLM